MELNESTIQQMEPAQLLGQDTLYDLYEIGEAERARLTALLQLRARDLQMEKEFSRVLRAFDKANQKLADEYSRSYARKNAEIPLVLNYKGKPENTIDNFLMVLRGDPHFDPIRFNLLTHSPETMERGELRRWNDTDDAETRYYIESKYQFHHQQKLEDALRIIFHEREYHPIKNIIEAAKWDGIERIPTFLPKWTKCEDSPYTREVSRLVFAGGINRLYRPGCKFDDMVVLIGTKQGEGKSTFVRWLALRDEFFREVNEFEGQKGIEATEGGWICEVSELLALTKVKEQEAVKSYLTRLMDTYRKPFEKRVTEQKRQCIFIGTTNKEQFLTDKTGNRRFYPVKVNQSGYDLFEHEAEIKADILQCWAEAKAKFDRGEMLPYANRELVKEIRQQQEEAMEEDYREGLIAEYLEDKTEVCVLELWREALGNLYANPAKKDSNEIGLMMQKMEGWKKQKKASRTQDYGVQKVWVRRTPDETDETGLLPM